MSASVLRPLIHRISLAAVWLLLVCGCASNLPTIDTSFSLPGSRTFERGQLVFHADFLLPQHHRLVEEIVGRRDEIGTMLDLDISDQPVHIYLFKNETKFHEFVRRSYPELPERRAFFVNDLGRLNVYAWWSDKIGTDLRHEITHGYIHASVDEIPLWLDEGIAEYFEVASGFGGINRMHIDLLMARMKNGTWQPDLRRLESVVDPARMTQLDYAEAWLWTHFLLNDNPETRAIVQRRIDELEQGLPMTPVSSEIQRILPDSESGIQRYLDSLNSR